MLKGYVRAQGVNICSKRIGSCLVSVAPVYHQQRLTRTERATNPLPYNAQYFSHKIHMDQNQKLAMYGVTHVCATDGYSGRLVSHAIMPVKNNLLIYKHVFRWVIMSSMSQQSHWLAKNRIPCTWKRACWRNPIWWSSISKWGGGRLGWRPYSFLFCFGAFVIQSLWIEPIRCTIKVLTHWLICLVHWIRVMRGVMQIFFRYIWTHSLLKHPNITQLRWFLSIALRILYCA